MQDEDDIVGIKDTGELLEDEQKILEEASRLAEEADQEEKALQEEVQRIQQEHPKLVFEEGSSDLIGSGVDVSPEMMQWAMAHGMQPKTPTNGDRTDHPTKKSNPKARRVKKRKVQKKTRKANRKNRKAS